MTFSRPLGLGLLLLALAAQPGHAQDDAEALAMDFAMHDATFITFHEVGHLLVGELGLPVLGKEEDAVDALATILMLNDEGDDGSYDALIDAADGWYYNAVKSTGQGIDDLSYYDDHSLDVQRAYTMVCLMVGADPDYFGETADGYEIEREQQESCAFTYQQAHDSWTALLEPYVSDAESAEIEIVYADAGDYARFADELKAREILEKAAAHVIQNYALPGPVTFRAEQCGEANAYYRPDESAVIYCYELAADQYRLYIEDIYPAYYGEDAE